MKRTVYIWDKEQQKVVPIAEKTGGEHYHYVITDEMPGTWHPCDGQYYTSKANFRNTTRANGCVEIGNEKQTTRPKELSKSERIEDIKKVLHDAGIYRG